MRLPNPDGGKLIPNPEITITVSKGPTCPECGGVEVLLGGPVRPFKIDAGRGGWESNCADCKLWFIGNKITEREDRQG